MASKANIRAVVSGAKRRVSDFQRALKEIKRIKIRETQKAGKDAARNIATRYKFERYADDTGQVRQIRPYGAAWGKRKAQLKLDDRRGVARGGILKQVQSPLIYSALQDGFDIDIKRPNLTITGRATLGRSLRTLAGKAVVSGKGRQRAIVALTFKRVKTSKRSFLVNAYIDHFADQKAPGLGNLSNDDLTMIETRANDAIAQHLEAVGSAGSRFLRRGAAAKLRIDLRRMLK